MFEKFISLGWYCGTAAAMSKLGIRSFSGPFDWYQSDFSGVLNCLDNDFDDFLEKKNLVQLDIQQFTTFLKNKNTNSISCSII